MTADNATDARRILLASRPRGAPTADNFRLETLPIPTPGPGQVLVRAKFLSLDPYMRIRMDDTPSYSPALSVGDVMAGQTAGEVIASNNPGFVVGDAVLAQTGWQTHKVSDGADLIHVDICAAGLSTYLGVLGMPGFTAWAGMTVIAQPKAGETVVVAAATGPVGSMVGQLARLAGARAIGVAGGAEKCAWLIQELGFDVAIDHRAANFARLLADACPKGVDVYFETVGGAVWQAVLPLLNEHARVPLCGLVGQRPGVTSAPESISGGEMMRILLTKSVAVRGFINREFSGLRPAFLREMTKAVDEGRIRHREDIFDGLENAPAAFGHMLEGRTFGKALIRL